MLAVELIVFLAIPSVVSAEFNLFGFSKEENPQTFSEFQAKNILKKFSNVLLDKWMWMKSDNYSDPKERTVFLFLKQAINYDVWNYIFQDLPIETSIKVGKAIGEIVQLMTSDNSIKLAMEKIEKGSVKMSVDYLKKELFKMEVKAAFGATKVKYDTGEEKIDTNFQYVMVYIPIDDTKGNLITRIYSPYELTPPQTSASYGLAMGIINDLKQGEKIPPFIAEFKGIITNKNFSWYYQWEGEPEIKLYFPDNVPDFGFKSIPWYDKYIINPIKRTVNGMIDSITGFFSWGDIIEYVNLEESNTPNEEAKKEAEDMINGINNYENKEIKENKEEVVVYENQTVGEPKEQEEIQKPKEEFVEELKQECPLSINNPKRNTILINEVAWMGSLNSANDEWIELKNISTSEINLKNWSLYDRDKQINILIEKDILVPPYGFVLLERTDDNSVPFIRADQIYTGTISNSGESLYLFNQNCELEDFVEANSNWPAGNSKERLTMERSKDLTWHDYNGLGYMNIFGTPKQENSMGKEKAIIVAEKTSTSVTSSSGGGGGGTIISYCSQDNTEEPSMSSIVINEIAWMGGESSSSDEWIELKNVSSEEINMDGWQLLDKDNQIKIIFNSSDILSANSFYLLERTDDSSVPNIQADKIYSGALSDSDESLRLFNQNCQLIDEIIVNDSWLFGDNDLKKTMERDSQGWHTFSLLNADNVSGLWGTPKQENSEKKEEESQENNNEENQEESLAIPSSILITEISLGKEDNNEYVEIFNQTENEVNLCLDKNNCYYLSYFANTFNEEEIANHSWDDPSYNWKFPDNLTIAPNSYILIDVFGNSGGDFKVGEYSSQKLSNSSGSLSLFSNNPIYAGEEEKTKEEKIIYARQLKIDAIAWNKDDKEPEVKEGSAFIINQGNILGRKYYLGKYIDSNNNLNDFEEQKQSIKTSPSYPPEAINDLSIIAGDKKNSVILSWTSPFDKDTEKEELDYEIYYSLNKEIDINNLVNISDYTEIKIIRNENNISASINDLYYDSSYYFSVKAKDKELNYSEISNIVNYSISKAEHIKAYRYVDPGKRNKSFLAGPTNESFIEKSVFIKGKDHTEMNDELSLPLIDENENLYISGKLDGNSGIYAFDKEGNEKWHYLCQTGENFLLGQDGTIYLFCGEKLTGLSPSGKLKWQEDIYNFTGELTMGYNGNIYIISYPDSSYLNIVEDSENAAILKRIDLGRKYDFFSNIVIDSDNNLYFFAESTLFKFNGLSKIGERSIDPVYDENYEGEKDKIVRINELGLSQNGTLLFNIYNAKWDSSGRGHSVLCGLSKENISSDFLWTKEDMSYSVIGINTDEFYVQADLSGDYGWYHLYLYGINILTGEVNWGKHWSSNGSPVSKASFILSDVNNNIYFIRGGEIVGFNIKEITDNNPLNDKILLVSGIGYSSNSISLGKDATYFTDGRTIKKISF